MFAPLTPILNRENKNVKEKGNCTKIDYTIKDNIQYYNTVYKNGLK
jgi:hypothetical protein